MLYLYQIQEIDHLPDNKYNIIIEQDKMTTVLLLKEECGSVWQ